MIHLTVNSGHSRHSPRSEVSDGALAACRSLLAPGAHAVPGIPGDYSLKVTESPAGTWFGTVFRSRWHPLVSIAVAASDYFATGLWQEIERQYLRVTEMPGFRSADFAAPHQPESTPWCAVIVMLATPSEALWLGDFERCLAWAFLDERR